MYHRKFDDEEKAFQPALNPNQRQFIEDQKRYREKIELLHGGKWLSVIIYLKQQQK